MDPGVFVRQDAIIDVLWGDSPPPTAVGLVQAHASRIRRYLAAAESYERAMSLWRGGPFADVDLLSGHPGITALRQELVGMLLRYALVACALGEYHRVLSRVITLAGAGQRAAAIKVYDEVRMRLDRELGLYPAEELHEAYVRVLGGGIRAADRKPSQQRSAALADPAQVMPRQLPAAPRCFIGRASELQELSVLARRELVRSSGMVITAGTGSLAWPPRKVRT